MSGMFTVGEVKKSPGVYKRIENYGGAEIAGAAEDIGCAVVSGNWGALNKPVVVDGSTDISSVIGTGSGADVIREMRIGGANTIVVTRVGSGGTQATLTLKDTAASTPADAVTLTALYPGNRAFALTIKESLDDSTKKQAILYEGTKILESVTFDAGKTEPDNLVAALKGSVYVTATKKAAGNGTLAALQQKAFTAGTNPTVNTEAYSTGFAACEAENWNIVCVDTADPAVHTLLLAYVERLTDDGNYPLAVVSEKSSTALETRMQHGSAFNSEKMHYVLNSWIGSDGTVYDGYLAAARVAGMLADTASNESLTHSVVASAAALNERLTNAQRDKALDSGCIVLTLSKSGQVWIDKGINTLVTLSGSQDAGWKKIRRVKTRYELMNRIETTIEPMIGAVNNDANGRAAVVAAAQRVADAMIGEGKLLAGTVSEDTSNPASGDSAWFIVEVDDLDSIETIYLTFRFRFEAVSDTE